MNHLKQMRLLWEIQDIEKELRQLKQAKATKELTEEITSLKQLLLAQKEELEAGKAVYDTLQTELSVLQDKVTQAEGVCDQDQKELFQDNINHKEVEVLYQKGEADLAKYRRVQEEYLTQAEKKEKMHRQLAKKLKVFKQNKELYTRLTEQLQKQRVAQQELIEEKVRVLQAKRELVEPAWLGRYEGLGKQYPLTAVAQVKKGICSACYLGLSFESLRQALQTEAPIFCEHCGRLLYLSTEELQRK